jgi:F0F1-type ATP synthase assembly protein I
LASDSTDFCRSSRQSALSEPFQRSDSITAHIVGNAVQKVLLVQAISTIVFALGAFVSAGSSQSVSVLAGGGMVLVANLAYAWVARPSRMRARGGNAVLAQHVLAELAKLVLLFGLLAVAFASGAFAAGWLIAAIGVALIGHWLSMLLK